MVFTKEDAIAMSVLDVAQSLGMEMKKITSNEYYWTEHDSFKINTRKNKFQWYSRGLWGDAVDLVQIIKDVSYKEAMTYLKTGQFPEASVVEEVKQPFRYQLGRFEQPFDQARAYLKDVRGLSDETIDFFLSKGVIAQARKKGEGNYYEPVIVFKSLDNQGRVIGASYQGIVPNYDRYAGRGYLKQIAYNSDGMSGLNISIGQPRRLIFMEAPIDLMSYYELHKDSLQDVRLVAMDGLVKPGTISRYVMELLAEQAGDKKYVFEPKKDSQALEGLVKTSKFFHDGKNTDFITLAVDNDKAGRAFIERMQEQGIPVQVDIPPLPEGEKKMDWNDYLKRIKKEKGETMNQEETKDNSRLAQAQRKLERLESELVQATEAVFAHQAQTNGQPTNDKRGGKAFFKRRDQLEEKAISLTREIEMQKERIERLENQEENKRLGLNKNGSGLEMSVANIPRIKAAIERYYAGDSFYTRATIKKYEKRLVELEAMAERAQSTTISPGVQYLIDEGLVTQWQKQPTIYFIKDLRRVAFVLQEDGTFAISARYQPKTPEEKEKVVELLARSQEKKRESISNLEVNEPQVQYDIKKDEYTKKSLENTQGIIAETNVGDFPDNQEAAPLPEANLSQPLNGMSPHQTQSQPLLHFTIDGLDPSTYKKGYHPVSDKDLRKLNRYTQNLQQAAQFYLNELADSKVTYIYSDGVETGQVSIEFGKEHFMHLTGLLPQKEGQTAEQTLLDFANGQGHFDNLLIANYDAAFEKLQVLPELQEIIESDAFYFNDLSDIEKLHRLDLDKAIRTGDKDLLLALRTVDGVAIPASVMKLKNSLNLQLDQSQNEKIILGVYRERDGQIDQLSINETYIKDGGKELRDILERSRSEEVVLEENLQAAAEKSLDSDGDGISNEAEIRLGTDPYNAQSVPGKAKQREEDKRSLSDILEARDMAALSQHMKEGLQAYTNSDQYKLFLQAMSKFHDYSLNNVQLLLMQKPDISLVAGFNKWKEMGRSVEKGQKALKIWQPVIIKQKDENGRPILDENGKEKTVTHFKLGSVFDVSQTRGRELPKPIYNLENGVTDYENLYRAARQVSLDNGIPVSFKAIEGGANGYYHTVDREIVLADKQMSESQIMKTLFHEMAHSDLHFIGDGYNRSERELQAESIAYVVANHYGIDTSEYRFGYLHTWSQDQKGYEDLINQLQVVQKGAQSLISRIDTKLELMKSKSLGQDKFQSKLAQAKDKSAQAAQEKQAREQDSLSKKPPTPAKEL